MEVYSNCGGMKWVRCCYYGACFGGYYAVLTLHYFTSPYKTTDYGGSNVRSMYYKVLQTGI